MKKVLSLVLVLAMVLGSFSFVSAASYTDVTGTEFTAAVDRLSLLGILEGYPDGTFKPAESITRAEFAAVAVRAKGLKDVALAAQGLPTGFTDVPVTHWASGYVGTAARLGIVNGIGWGQFAPASPVKYEEAVTMIVRALGYEQAAQAKGGYPYGYLIVASEIDLLDGVKGTQGVAATRGLVAQLTDNALEIAMMVQVGYGTATKWVVSGSSEHDGKAVYLLNGLGVDEIEGTVTANARLENNKLKKNEILIDGDKYEVAANVDVDAILGLEVTAWEKDDVIFAVTVETDDDQIALDAVVTTDKNEVELYVLDDEFDWATKAVVYQNNKKINVEDIKDEAYGRFVFNDDNEVMFAYLFVINADDMGIVTEIDKTDMEFASIGAVDIDVLALDDAEAIYVFNKDLSAASLDDIEVGTSVFYFIDGDDNYFIVISSEVVEGNLDSVRSSDSRVTVGGTNVVPAELAIYSADEMDNIKLWSGIADVKDFVDEDVVVYLNLVGDAMALVTDAKTTSSTIYGIATYLTTARNPVLSVYTEEGKEVDYTFEETDNITAAFKLLSADFTANITGVSFKVNKDGEIAKNSFAIATTEQAFVKEADNKFATVGTSTDKLYITKDTVILKALNSTNKLKPSVIKYENIIEKEIKDNNDAIVMKINGNDLALVVFTETAFAAVDSDEYGIVTASPRKVGSDYKVVIDVAGEGKVDYVLSSNAMADVLRSGDLVKFNLNDKGAASVQLMMDLSVEKESASEVVTKKDGNYLTTASGTYRASDETLYYVTTDKGGLDTTTRLARIAKDDTIIVLANSNDELKVVLVTTPYTATLTPGTPGVTTGVVTYINATDSTILVDGVAYEIGIATILNNASGDVVAVGKTDVFAALTKFDEVKDIVVVGGVIKSFTGTTLAKQDAAIRTVVTTANVVPALSATHLNAVAGLTYKTANIAAYETAILALTAPQKLAITTLAQLQAEINKVDLAVTKAAEELLGTNLNTLLGSATFTTAATVTNKQAVDARADYNELTAAGIAKVTAANLAKLVAAEKALADAKIALANEISAAQTLYTAQNTRLAVIEADSVLVADIIAEKSTEPAAYRVLVNALNSARAVANAKVVTADGETATSITGYNTTLTSAKTAVTEAKVIFDAIVAVVNSGK